MSVSDNVAMKRWLFILCMVTAIPLFASESKDLKSENQNFKLFSKEKLWVSESCLKKDCLALKQGDSKVLRDPSNQFTGQPAAQFCIENDGKYVVGKYESGDEDGLCIFNDKSYILGWDYYKNNRGKK